MPNQNADDCQEHQLECQRYPELWRCYYSISEPCDYVWRAPDGALIIVEAGIGMTEHDIWLEREIRLADAREVAGMCDRRPSPFPPFKRHTPYADVRAKLMSLGYRPSSVADPRSTDCDVFQDRCVQFPEMIYCSEAGTSLCEFLLRSPNGTLVLVKTVGESPGFYAIYEASPRKSAPYGDTRNIASTGDLLIPVHSAGLVECAPTSRSLT